MEMEETCIVDRCERGAKGTGLPGTEIEKIMYNNTHGFIREKAEGMLFTGDAMEILRTAIYTTRDGKCDTSI